MSRKKPATSVSVDSWALANHQAVLSHHSILELDLVVPEDLSVLVLKAESPTVNFGPCPWPV